MNEFTAGGGSDGQTFLTCTVCGAEWEWGWRDKPTLAALNQAADAHLPACPADGSSQ